MQVNLTGVFLGNINISDAIILSTDLRAVEGITQQLESRKPPFICNSPLPQNIQIDGGKDRDCKILAEILLIRYPNRFNNLTAAVAYLQKERKKAWK